MLAVAKFEVILRNLIRETEEKHKLLGQDNLCSARYLNR
jgi:hypothetical protein